MKNMVITGAIDILKQFENDPKAQECLDIYQRLTEDKRSILLIFMDVFALGMETGAKIKAQSQK